MRVDSSASAIHPRFDLTSSDTSPFPSDRFTVADDQNLTRRRVNLPPPSGCRTHKSDCEDVLVLNELDGFSLRPLVTIPFDGDIDVSTTAGNIFFVSLGDTTDNWTDDGPDSVPAENADRESLRRRRGFGQVMGVTQIVWDPTTRVLHAKADGLLDEHTRYALVVTNGIRDANGRTLASSEEFRNYQQVLRGSADRWYRKALLAAEWAARRSTSPPKEIVALSSFTTQSVTYLQEKITKDVLTSPPPGAADFNLGPAGTRAVFPFDRVEAIVHNQQTSPNGGPVPGRPYNLTGARWVPGAVGHIAFGRFIAPDYLVHPGEYIPPMRSRIGTPRPQGANTLYFTLILPSGQKPRNGWPVVVFAHGGNGTSATTPLEIAAIPASHGLALLTINLVGHGAGPASTLTVRTIDGISTTLPMPGRGFDQDGDGTIGTAEGHNASAPRVLRMFADAVTQIGADHLALIRLIERGIDVDTDGQLDLDATRVYLLGQSFGAGATLPLLPQTRAIRASYFLVPGPLDEIRRLGVNTRPALGTMLARRTPPLANPSSGLRLIGGVAISEPFFNENIPYRYSPPVINTVAGAMPIQRTLDRLWWATQTGDGFAFARALRKSASAVTSLRPTVIFLGRGDQSANIVGAGVFVRDGELEDRTVLYRHDLFFAANPTSIKNSHTVYRFQGPDAPTNPITVAIQEQFSRFFASDGNVLEQTSPYLETPMKSLLPPTLDFIP